MDGRPGRRHRKEGPERAHFLLEQLLEHARQNSIDAVLGQHRLREHHRARAGGPLPGNIAIESACAPTCAGTPWPWWSRRQPPEPGRRRRPGRAHRLVCLAGQHVGRGFNHFWHAESEDHGGDLPLHPGPQRPRHLRPRLPGRPPDARSSSTASARKWTAKACRATRTPS